MALPYKRSFTKGRGSELLYNEDLHKIYETTRHISEQPPKGEEPELKLHGALWRDDRSNELKYCNTLDNKWEIVFGSKFQITDQMLVEILPANPVTGQLWIHNQALYYFDGTQWLPIKALPADDSQFAEAAFADFLLVSPLLSVGHTVENLEENNGYYQHYYKDKVDYENKQDYLYTDQKWEPGWKNPFTEPQKGLIDAESKTQFIMPNVTHDKFFIDNTLRHDFEKVSSVCIQYPTQEILNTTESVVHVNYGKLTNIVKRLVKVDKANPTIQISPYHTEYYGFRNGEYLGDFLVPSSTENQEDYIVDHDSILLNYTAAQNYDYVLAVTYTFGWIHDTGSLHILTSGKLAKGYYLQDMKQPLNVFINGLNLERRYYDTDESADSVTITDENFSPELHEVDVLRTVHHEFGYIRDTDIQGRGIIKLISGFIRPLVFINGQLMHPTFDGLVYNKDRIIVPGAKINMPWAVLETKGRTPEDSLPMLAGYVKDAYWNDIKLPQDSVERGDLIIDKPVLVDNETSSKDLAVRNDPGILGGPYLPNREGIVDITIEQSEHQTIVVTYDGKQYTDSVSVPKGAAYTVDVIADEGYDPGVVSFNEDENYGFNVYIQYPFDWLDEDDGVVLFLNGLLISKSDIVIDRKLHTVTTKQGLHKDDKYVLLRDKGDNLYDDLKLVPALDTGKLDAGMIYLNGKLLHNVTPQLSAVPKEEINTDELANFEVKCFVDDQASIWSYYDAYHRKWVDASPEETENIARICGSYTQSTSSVHLNVPYSEEDEIYIYALRFANTIADVLKIGTAWLDSDAAQPNYNKNKDYYHIPDPFVQGKGMLSVYVNGVKQVNGIDFREQFDGQTIRLLNPKILSDRLNVQYIVEAPENGAASACVPIVLTQDNMTAPNVYAIPDSSDLSFFPGRLSVYLNGKRLPKEDWTLLGNKSILIKNQLHQTTGELAGTYPTETYQDGTRIFEVTHTQPDVLLVEVRQEFTRQEITFTYPGGNEIYIDDLSLPRTILATADEILFYVDGLFAGLSNRDSKSYHLDRYKGCIVIDNPTVLEVLNTDKLYSLLQSNQNIYNAWKIRNKQEMYTPRYHHKMTLLWR